MTDTDSVKCRRVVELTVPQMCGRVCDWVVEQLHVCPHYTRTLTRARTCVCVLDGGNRVQERVLVYAIIADQPINLHPTLCGLRAPTYTHHLVCTYITGVHMCSYHFIRYMSVG
jgi:hypothetical protein